MKKRLAIAATGLGLAIALTACGQTETPAEAPAAEITETPAADTDSAETTNTETADTAEAAAVPEGYVEDMVISNDLITLTMPDELAGKFYASVDGDMITIYDKACVDEGFPGLVFQVGVDKDNTLIPGGMYTKVGELSSSDGNLYNVVRGFASEAQWDYEKYDDVPETYEKLESAAADIIADIQGVDNNTYIHEGGTKGEELYTYTLSRYIDAYTENWDANKYEEEGLSPEFYALIANEGEKAFDKIGFAYMDVTNDGIDELLVGVITDDEASTIYDIYTMVDRMPTLVVSGTARDSYHALQYGGIANYYSGGAMENGVTSYIIEPDSSNLLLQFGIKYDAYTDEENPWFIEYSDEEWEAMTEEDYNSRLEMLDGDSVKLDFAPMSDIVPIDYSKVDLSQYATFTKMLDDFKPGMGYANEKLGDTDVFLASAGTYNWDGNDYAIDSSLFMYDEDGNIVYLGRLQSAGTAYPLAIADGCIYTCTHHSIQKTTVKDGKLVTEECAEEVFDEDGNTTYTYNDKPAEDGTDLTRLFEEYDGAQLIVYSVEK